LSKQSPTEPMERRASLVEQDVPTRTSQSRVGHPRYGVSAADVTFRLCRPAAGVCAAGGGTASMSFAIARPTSIAAVNGPGAVHEPQAPLE